MRSETGTSILFISYGPLALLTFYFFLGLLYSIFYPALVPAWSFFVTIFCSDFGFLEITGCLNFFSTYKIASNLHPAAFLLSCNFIVKY